MARALTTSEAVARLMELGLSNHRIKRIGDNELTLPYGATTDDVFYAIDINESYDGRSYVGLYRFVKKYWNGKDLGASGSAIFVYSKANAKEKKLFMDIVEREFGVK